MLTVQYQIIHIRQMILVLKCQRMRKITGKIWSTIFGEEVSNDGYNKL